jgi:hypothetical protein
MIPEQTIEQPSVLSTLAIAEHRLLRLGSQSIPFEAHHGVDPGRLVIRWRFRKLIEIPASAIPSKIPPRLF